MTIKDIRKKHEVWKTIIEEDNEDLNLYRSALSISGVDQLFAALDEAEAQVEGVREAVESNYERPATLRGVIKNIIGEGKK